MPPKSSKRKTAEHDLVPGQTTLSNFIIANKKFKAEEPPKESVQTEFNKENSSEVKQQTDVKPTTSIENNADKKVEEVAEKDDSGFPSYEDWLKDLGDWKEPLKNFLDRGSLKQIHKLVKEKYKAGKVYPPPELIFNAFKKVSFADVKVVIVGQDPYIAEGQAMGMSFSVPKGIRIPGSLRNIYSALKNDKSVHFNMPKPLHGDLTKWASQGVLLINSTLTVNAGVSNSHKDLGWSKFTDEVIQAIGRKKSGVVFMLWGKFAQAKEKFVDRDKHKVLKFIHPSPLAAKIGAGFTECPHFSQANKYLENSGKGIIDWNVD